MPLITPCAVYNRDNGSGLDVEMTITSRIDWSPDETTAPVTEKSTIEIDPFRMFSFPNSLRECRAAAGFPSLLALSERLPDIPYIRLSKIERGEVFGRAEELCRIAQVLGLANPATLLIDPDAPGFSWKSWAGSRATAHLLNRKAQELAMLLAAAMRRLRATQPGLTLARLQEEHHLPAVIVSRIENAAKPFDRWNTYTISALIGLFGAEDRNALIALLRRDYHKGALAEWLARIPGATERETRTRERIAALRTELGRMGAWNATAKEAEPELPPPNRSAASSPIHLDLQVIGVPLGDGLIEPFPNPQTVASPPGSGPHVYALRMCRASLGAAIPGNAVLIVDPDRPPVQGGIAVLKESEGLRVLALSTDRGGKLIGHSINPEREIVLDTVAPGNLAMVTAVLFP